MTVNELIEKLKTFPPEVDVFIADWSEEYSQPTIFSENEVAYIEFPIRKADSHEIEMIKAVLIPNR